MGAAAARPRRDDARLQRGAAGPARPDGHRLRGAQPAGRVADQVAPPGRPGGQAAPDALRGDAPAGRPAGGRPGLQGVLLDRRARELRAHHRRGSRAAGSGRGDAPRGARGALRRAVLAGRALVALRAARPAAGRRRGPPALPGRGPRGDRGSADGRGVRLRGGDPELGGPGDGRPRGRDRLLLGAARLGGRGRAGLPLLPGARARGGRHQRSAAARGDPDRLDAVPGRRRRRRRRRPDRRERRADGLRAARRAHAGPRGLGRGPAGRGLRAVAGGRPRRRRR